MVLGFKDLTKTLHKPLCDKVGNQDSKKRLWLWPRGFFKTSIINVGHTIQLILNNPNIRILLAMSTLDNAKEKLAEIKSQFLFNEHFRFLFPEFCPKSGDWGTQIAVTVPNRTDFTKAEGTIEAVGTEQKITGRHYDYLKKDDLVTPETVTTEEQIKKTIDWDKYTISLFENPQVGREDYIGTRYHDADLYGEIIRNKPEIKAELLRAVENGIPLFPERFDLKTLASIKQDQGSYIFSTQYMNDPISAEDADFKKEWIKYYKEIEYPKGCYITAVIDPAISTTKGSCFSAITICGMSALKKIYLRYTFRNRILPHKLIDKIFDINELFKRSGEPIRKWGIEVVAFQKLLKYDLQREAKKRGIYIPIVELKTDTTKSKEARILGLQPYFFRGQVLLKSDMFELEEEILRFPRGKYKDLIDSLAYHLDLLLPGSKRELPPPPAGSFFKAREEAIKHNRQLQPVVREGLQEWQ